MKSLFSKTFLLSLLLSAVCTGVSSTAYGQIWTDHNEHDPGIVSVEAMIPAFDDFLGAEAPSSTWELYTRFPVTGNLSVIASLPVSHFETSGRALADISETSIGNPFLGVRIKTTSHNVDIDAGVRLPVASNDDTGLLTGILIDNHSLSRFTTETTTFSGVLRYHRDWESGLILRAGIGPEIWLPDEGSELIATYYGQLLYRSDPLTLGAGFSGLNLVTESDISFGDRTLTDIGILGSYRFGNFRTGAFLRFPLDDEISDFLDFVLGINLGFVLN